MTSADRPLRTALVGLDSFWTGVLAQGLSARYPAEFTCSTLLQGDGLLGIPRYAATLLRSDLVVRVGATFRWDSRLDRFMLTLPQRRAPRTVAVYWTGTDVLLLQRAARAGRLTEDARALLAGVHHMAGAQHLADELAELGVQAASVPFPAMALAPPPAAPPMPERFRVLTYLPAASGERFAFYGGPQYLEAARALPEVEFAVMGAPELLADVPPNVVLLGRVDDPQAEYARTSVVVRIVEHDAIGGTVCEGLMYGRHVIYTYDVPHTLRVEFADAHALVLAIRGLHERHLAGALGLNAAGFEYAQVEFDPDRRFARMRDVLLGFVASDSAEKG